MVRSLQAKMRPQGIGAAGSLTLNRSEIGDFSKLCCGGIAGYPALFSHGGLLLVCSDMVSQGSDRSALSSEGLFGWSAKASGDASI